MRDIVIIGAGAIGRGFLPWAFDTDSYRLTFVDSNPRLVELMKAKGSYSSYRSKNGKYETKIIKTPNVHLMSDYSIQLAPDPAVVFMCVGPRNCAAAAAVLRGVKCPVVLCENDPETVAIVREALGFDCVYFAIPDVITSNTASPDHLSSDPLAIHTEDGVLFIDERAKSIDGEIRYCDEEELKKQWAAKLYLHNTPHCIAAYLGSIIGAQYLHEAMQNREVADIVNGAMNEMLTALKLRWDIPHDFLDWYAGKEIQRFANVLLFDPISRVAREPLRKLELSGRLIGAAQMCLSLGFVPKNLLKGIVSALLFSSKDDSDKHLAFVRRSLNSQMLLTYIVGLRAGEVLETVLEEWYPKIAGELELLAGNVRKEAS
jgi:mannitol-1-phosphate 5-dehydrogenase